MPLPVLPAVAGPCSLCPCHTWQTGKKRATALYLNAFAIPATEKTTELALISLGYSSVSVSGMFEVWIMGTAFGGYREAANGRKAPYVRFG